MDFVIDLPISADEKSDNFDLILVIDDQLMKRVYYALVKVMIDIPNLAKVIINMIMYHHGVFESILSD